MEQRTLHRTIGRPLDLPLSIFDIRKALSDLRAEPALEAEGRNSIILHKEDGLKVVLVAMRAGNEIHSHKAGAPITVQVLEGCVSFEAGGETRRLAPGALLTLRSGTPHAVRAPEDSAFLLTIAGRGGE